MERWKKLLLEARTDDAKCGAGLFDRVTRLVKVFNDNGYRKAHPGFDEYKLAGNLDREVSEVMCGFMGLMALQEHCPDRDRWANEDLGALYGKMLTDQRVEPQVKKSKTSGTEHDLKIENLALSQEAAKLKRECAKLNKAIARLEKENAELREAVAESLEASLA